MYRLIHNGMDIRYCLTMQEVNNNIKGVLNDYTHLAPKLIYNYKVGKAVFMCYRYNTMYCEMFLIEEDE